MATWGHWRSGVTAGAATLVYSPGAVNVSAPGSKGTLRMPPLQARFLVTGAVVAVTAALTTPLITSPATAQPPAAAATGSSAVAPSALAATGAADGALGRVSDTATPRLTTDAAKVRAGTSTEAARTYLADRRSRLRIDVAGLTHLSSDDSNGSVVERFAQQYRGIPVLGAQYVVRMDASKGGYTVRGTSGDYFSDLQVDVRRKMPLDQARLVAEHSLSAKTRESVEQVRDNGLVIVPQGRGVLTRHLTLTGYDAERQMPMKREMYLAMGRTAPVVDYDDLQTDGPVSTTGSGFHGDQMPLELTQEGSTYLFRDQTRGTESSDTEIATYDAKGIDYMNFVGPLPDGVDLGSSEEIPVPESANTAGLIDAHWGAGHVYDFYRGFGRDSLDGEGGAIRSVVNVTANGQPYVNAFWNGQLMVYGNGDASMRPFAASLDVVGHEMTHGVVDHTSDLMYIGQSGALNEALADYFGNAVENQVKQVPPGPHDGLLGEDLCVDKAPEDCALRDLNSLMTTLELFQGAADNGGVHLNSPIPSGTLWQIRAELGADVADPIVYDVMTKYLTPLSDFLDLREATLAAAEQHGLAGGDLQTIKDAFKRHGILPGWERNLAGVDAKTLVSPLLTDSVIDVSGNRWIATNVDLEKGVNRVLTGRIGAPGSRSLAPVGRDYYFGPFGTDQKSAMWFRTTYTPTSFEVDIQSRKFGGKTRTLAELGHVYAWSADFDDDQVAWSETVNDRGIIKVLTKRGKIRQIPLADGREASSPTIRGNYVLYGENSEDYDQTAKAQLKRYDIRTGKVKTLATVSPEQDSSAYVVRPQFVGKQVLFLSDAQYRLRTGLMSVPLDGGKVRTLIPEDSDKAPFADRMSAAGRLVTYENLLNITDPARALVLDRKTGRIGRVSCSTGDQVGPAPGEDGSIVWVDTSTSTPSLVSRDEPRRTCPE